MNEYRSDVGVSTLRFTEQVDAHGHIVRVVARVWTLLPDLTWDVKKAGEWNRDSECSVYGPLGSADVRQRWSLDQWRRKVGKRWNL